MGGGGETTNTRKTDGMRHEGVVKPEGSGNCEGAKFRGCANRVMQNLRGAKTRWCETRKRENPGGADSWVSLGAKTRGCENKKEKKKHSR